MGTIPFIPSMIIPSTSKCVPCKYNNYQPNFDGSELDFLCSVYFDKILGLFPYVRTFRQYNKKSPIIIFINEAGYNDIQPLDKTALRNCGVTTINLGDVQNHFRGLQIVRLLYFYDFLKSSKTYFKRCIFTDGFDVFFQGDPFTSELTETNIYLTLENETNNFINTSYYEKFPSYYKIICSQNIVNCGVFAGGTQIVYNFFTLYLQMFPGLMAIESQTIHYSNPYSDQDALNYFVYIYCQKLPLRNYIVLLPTTSNFASMIGEVRYNVPGVIWNFPHFSLLSDGKRVRPILIHQYTYSDKLVKSLMNVCKLLPHQRNYHDYYRL